MLVSAKEMLQKAVAGQYAIGQFNINNLEWTKSILLAAEEVKAPVILGVSEGANTYMTGYQTVSAMVRAMDQSLRIRVPVALHLDHGKYEGAKACIECGYTSVMFDGSKFPLEENLEKTRELVELAHQKGISVEAEVGTIGEDATGGEIADPYACRQLKDLGIDFLAAGIGNIHGIYPENWPGLRFDALEAIKAQIGDLPLVLHGGTGIPQDQIQKAIRMGVAKINVNTDLQLVFAQATRAYIEEEKDQEGKGFDPRKLLLPGQKAIEEKVKETIRLFGSEGKGE